jgi:hypothetical protein
MATAQSAAWEAGARQHTDRAGWIIFGVLAGPTVAGLVGVTFLSVPWQVLFVLPLLLVVVWIARTPVVGMYVLFGASLVIPVQSLGFPDSLIDNIPFFINLSGGGSLSVSGLGISPAEILMLITLIGVLAYAVANRESLSGGPLMRAYLVFVGAIILGELNGLTHGGDFKLSLWELRPQAYGVALFLIGTVLIRERSQLKVLLAILLASEVLTGIVGSYRYLVTLNHNVMGELPILAHEDSYLMGLFVVAVVAGLIWIRRPLLILLIALMPLVLTAILGNHRRAGTGALGVMVVTIMVLAYVLEPRLRGVLVKVGVVMAVVGVAVTVIFWNQQTGAIAELIRPVKSIVDPSARDLSSDLYRIAETANLRGTYRTSPLFGIGFGHPYYMYYPQTGVAKFDPLWDIIPHNNLLWIPVRMGVIGMVAFWSLVSLAIIQAIWVARAVGDRFVRTVLVFSVAAILGLLFTGYYDIAIENYRNMIVLGLVFAVINVAARLGSADEPPTRPAHTAAAAPAREPAVAAVQP